MSWSRHRRIFDGMKWACLRSRTFMELMCVCVYFILGPRCPCIRRTWVCMQDSIQSMSKIICSCHNWAVVCARNGLCFLFALYFMRLRLRVWCFVLFHLTMLLNVLLHSICVQVISLLFEYYAVCYFLLNCAFGSSAPFSFTRIVFTLVVLSLTRHRCSFPFVRFRIFVC